MLIIDSVLSWLIAGCLGGMIYETLNTIYLKERNSYLKKHPKSFLVKKI